MILDKGHKMARESIPLKVPVVQAHPDEQKIMVPSTKMKDTAPFCKFKGISFFEVGSNMKSEQIVLHSIGYIRNAVHEVKPMRDAWKEIVSEVVLEPGLSHGLQGLERFSHVMVLFWMHHVDEARRGARAGGIGNNGPPTGTFALRTPNRPNPIGVSIVQLLERRDNVLRVVGLDAVDGSPLLDIKAYSPRHDAVSDTFIPGRAAQLW